jgi:DNA repair protein RadC
VSAARGKSAVDLGRELISRFGGLNGLFAASQADFSAVPGMGPAKCAQLQAVLEMVRRALGDEMRRGIGFSSPAAVRDYLRLHLAGLQHEVFFALWLDAQNRLIAAEELFRGTLTQTSVYPREVVKQALRHNAAAVVLAHNHPSGVAEPSRADELLTSELKQVLALGGSASARSFHRRPAITTACLSPNGDFCKFTQARRLTIKDDCFLRAKRRDHYEVHQQRKDSPPQKNPPQK